MKRDFLVEKFYIYKYEQAFKTVLRKERMMIRDSKKIVKIETKIKIIIKK